VVLLEASLLLLLQLLLDEGVGRVRADVGGLAGLVVLVVVVVEVVEGKVGLEVPARAHCC
jgi:hypothetical protein